MKSISLKLQDQTLKETDTLLKRLETSRNKYINEAIEYYNKYQSRKFLKEQLAKESLVVSEDSLSVLAEFERLEDEI